MSIYQLKIQPPAKRALRERMPSRLAHAAAELMLALRDDPFPAYSAPLERELQDRRKIRVNGWRIIYTVKEENQLVIVWDIRPRSRNTYLNVP